MLTIALLAVAAAWAGMLILVMALCKAARAGEQTAEAHVHPTVAAPSAADTRIGMAPVDRADGASVEWPGLSFPARGKDLEARQGAARPTANEMRLSAAEAAEILGVAPEALLAWEERYGYPSSTASVGGDSGTFRVIEVMALASAIQSGLSISAAVRTAMGVTQRRFQSAGRSPGPQLAGGAQRDAEADAS